MGCKQSTESPAAEQPPYRPPENSVQQTPAPQPTTVPSFDNNFQQRGGFVPTPNKPSPHKPGKVFSLILLIVKISISLKDVDYAEPIMNYLHMLMPIDKNKNHNFITE